MKNTFRIVLALTLSFLLVFAMTVAVSAAKPNRSTEIAITDFGTAPNQWNFTATYSFTDFGAWGWAASWQSENADWIPSSGTFDGRTTSKTDELISVTFDTDPGDWVFVTIFLTKKNGNGIGKDYSYATSATYYLP